MPGHDETPILHAESLFRVLSGSDTWREPIIVQNIPDGTIDGSYYDERAVRTARHKLILRKFEKAPALRPGELYDLETDQDERSNLYASQVRLLGEVGKQLEEWGRRTGDDTAIELARYAQR